MTHFLRAYIWVTEENTTPYKRFAMIPFDIMVYMHEGNDRSVTDIILDNGSVVCVAETYILVFSAWEKWYSQQNNNFISYTNRNN